MASRRLSERELDEFVARLESARDKLAPLFPDIDPGDLLQLIELQIRPKEIGRRFLLKKNGPNSYVI